MYLLDRMHLVQFYLFSAETLRFGRSSAVVAPNGSGKSSILDAMQIVLHGGDQHAISLNAQSGGKPDGRSIREYLLGYYQDNAHVRDNATCYLTMVFRDSEGGQPTVSAGLCLGATVGEQRHRTYGMYILPGVDLTLEDHTVATPGEPLPLAWKEFKVQAEEKARASGADAPEVLGTVPANEFVRKLMYRLGGTTVDVKQFTKAFGNALNLKDVHDASSFVRERIIDDRPINTVEFRNQLESFRVLNAKIVEVEERIKVGEALETKALDVIEARMELASLTALLLDFERDAAMDALEAADTELETAKGEHQASARMVTKAKEEEAAAKDLVESIVRLERDDPQAIAVRSLQEDRERRLSPLKKDMTRALQRVVDAFDRATHRDGSQRAWSLLSQPWRDVLASIRATNELESLPFAFESGLESIRASLQGIASVVDGIDRQAREDEVLLESRRRALQVAEEALERARQGKRDLHESILGVIRRLGDVGVEAVPVCDLVSIRDPAWAPVVESYLNRNVSALLVPLDDEDAAIQVYEEIPASANPYVARIVQQTSLGAEKEPGPDTLASLITGADQRAVRFLQTRLGSLRKLTRANRAGRDGITLSGTIVNQGTIGRVRPKADDELLLGTRSKEGNAALMASKRRDAAQALEQIERQSRASAALRNEVKPLQALEVTLDQLAEHIEQHRREEQLLDASEELLDAPVRQDLIERHQRLVQAQERHRTARLAVDAANQQEGRTEGAENTAKERQHVAEEDAKRKAAVAAAAMQRPHVDAGWIDHRRNTWEKAGKSAEEQQALCRRRVETLEANRVGEISGMRVAFVGYQGQEADSSVDASDPDVILAIVRKDLQRLKESELASYKRRAEEAYDVAVRTFRSRIAASLRDSFERLATQIDGINDIMARMPAFTNDERYHFKRMVNKEHAALHKFIEDVADRGADDTMFDDPVHTPPEFRALLEDVDGPSQDLLRDYRKFYSFDLEVRQHGKPVSTLRSRMEKGSGGEHRAPLYIVAGAALAAAYGKLQGRHDGASVILFDELGDKIDGNNTRAVFRYLRSLGLQPIVAAPDDALGKINESIDGYIELHREEGMLAISHVGFGADAHGLLESDSWLEHPELLEDEVRKIRQERGGEPT